MRLNYQILLKFPPQPHWLHPLLLLDFVFVTTKAATCLKILSVATYCAQRGRQCGNYFHVTIISNA